MEERKQKIAVIGGGVAGLSSAYLLSKKHNVTLFESGSELGGHAHSVKLEDEKSKKQFYVDTAFLIFNEKTYPQFKSFIHALGVEDQVIPGEMSSCFSDHVHGLHYTLGLHWTHFLKRPQCFIRKGFVKICSDLLKFRKRAVRDLENPENLAGVTADDYLAPYSKYFVENFVLPLTSAIWSLPSAQMRHYPILPLLKYFDNHQLLRGRRGRNWRTFHGSSRVYVEAFEQKFRGEIRKQTVVSGVRRKKDSVHVEFIEQKSALPEAQAFDQVVLATHADVSFKLLINPTPLETHLLSVWEYKNNSVTLHSDPAFLHQDRELWGSWNMTRRQSDYQISYYLNRLQRLQVSDPVILTLADIEPSNQKFLHRFQYRHPIFNEASIATQKNLSKLNGSDRIFFCGSYFGYGFHEDAVQSAADVAKCFSINWDEISQ